jgi:hypothetical protein
MLVHAKFESETKALKHISLSEIGTTNLRIQRQTGFLLRFTTYKTNTPKNVFYGTKCALPSLYN